MLAAMLMPSIETILEGAVETVSHGADLSVLDQLLVPIYIADGQGFVRYFNSACIEFAGRRPEVGRDRWCVTWRLYTEIGEFLPHNQCPMAMAIKTQRPIRGVTALAERPDGTKVVFRPYPTPLFVRHGQFTGALNVFENVTDEARAEELEAKAERCRRLAKGVDDAQVAEALSRLAEECDSKATDIRDKLTFSNSRTE